MLDTALRQLRHGWAVATGGRIRVTDVEALVRHLRATSAEFGYLEREQMLEALGTAVDPEFRRSMDARRCRAVVRKAYEETTYYRTLLDELRMRPRDLSLDRIAELPPTPKSVLRALPEAFVSSRAEPVLQATSTGTTGMPTSCWFSAYELDLAAAYGAASLMINLGLSSQDVVGVCNSSRAVLGIHNVMASARMVGAGALLLGLIDPEEALSRLATPVHLPGKKPRISVLSVLPSYLGQLLQTAQRLGYDSDDFGLERIVCGGEVLSDSLRERVEAFFAATIDDGYSMTEIFPLGALVCSQRHLHFAADQGLVEVLDPVSFEPVEPGAVGSLVVTPFLPYRETTLVLRLATGDLVRRLRGHPSCELGGLPATSPVLGRAASSGATGTRPLYQRDILDLLECEPALPLPVRYGVESAIDGIDLHVLGPSHDLELHARLEQRATTRELPVRKLVLHPDVAEIARPEFVRSLLRETAVVREEVAGTWTLR